MRHMNLDKKFAEELLNIAKILKSADVIIIIPHKQVVAGFNDGNSCLHILNGYELPSWVPVIAFRPLDLKNKYKEFEESLKTETPMEYISIAIDEGVYTICEVALELITRSIKKFCTSDVCILSDSEDFKFMNSQPATSGAYDINILGKSIIIPKGLLACNKSDRVIATVFKEDSEWNVHIAKITVEKPKGITITSYLRFLDR